MNTWSAPHPIGPVGATVTPPGSKSITNRALVCAALADRTSILSNALFADDTQVMIESLRALGFAVTPDLESHTIEITGRAGHIPATSADLFCGNSGTTIRFCTALAALGQGQFSFDGIERMHHRPIGTLIDALCNLGAHVEYVDRQGYPPFKLHASRLTGGTIEINNPESSQYVSALMLAAPCANDDVLLDVSGPLVSKPYITLTSHVMQSFGVATIDDIKPDRTPIIIPAPQQYRAANVAIEPDASNASYFLAMPAIIGGSMTIQGLGTDSAQGDIAFVDLLHEMGCRIEKSPDSLTVKREPKTGPLKPLDVDLADMPDMTQTLAVLALFADGPTAIRNVENLRIKETDRLSALASELRALGAQVTENADGLIINPPETLIPATIKTYDDHRMAMSFALAALADPKITIADPECVRKTFPDFFQQITDLCRSQH